MVNTNYRKAESDIEDRGTTAIRTNNCDLSTHHRPSKEQSTPKSTTTRDTDISRSKAEETRESNRRASSIRDAIVDTPKNHKGSGRQIGPSRAPDMSKLSPALKQLINAPFSRPSYTTPNAQILNSTLSKLASSAREHNVSTPAWLTFSTATAMTMNAPGALTSLWQTAQSNDRSINPVLAAELQREVGLKCISFNGIPRTINCLGAFYNSLPEDVRSKLSTKSTRELSDSNIQDRKSDGLGLWDSVYYGFERKLLDKLGQSHPDLPVTIINGHYATLLSNPSRGTYVDGEEKPREAHVGRVLTSLVAIACLRAQTGVGPQVVSHVFGLRKAYERGDAAQNGEVEVQGGKWLSTEEGNRWLLEWIDELVRSIGTTQDGEPEGSTKQSTGTTFAPGIGSAKERAKL